ncbi:hypothetical protein V1477_015571 [Vespula maculifrons]|uniref:Uncharacterized protein n=1 Tax=Vespula maculifrons TaxID=7453 RepID=A0ABD2BEL3_VESMC
MHRSWYINEAIEMACLHSGVHMIDHSDRYFIIRNSYITSIASCLNIWFLTFYVHRISASCATRFHISLMGIEFHKGLYS